MDIQKVECKFVDCCWQLDRIYTCLIKNQIISEDAKLQLIGTHKNAKTNKHIQGIYFKDCTVTKVPQGLMKIFPNLKCFGIFNSKLKLIEEKDLKEYKGLSIINFTAKEIHYLTSDLFSGMTNLESIWLNGNKIEVFEPNLLDGLDKLKYVNLKENPCIDKCFDSIENDGNATWQEIKDEIKQKFFKQKVHKFLLCARSPVLKEMIEINIDAEYLNLIDISKENFQVIFNFIYTDEMPVSNNINFIHLYAAAGRLKMDQLMNFAADKLINQVNIENALEILTLAKKFESKKLQLKSFEVLKEYLKKDVKDISDELAMQPEKIKEYLDYKKRTEC